MELGIAFEGNLAAFSEEAVGVAEKWTRWKPGSLCLDPALVLLCWLWCGAHSSGCFSYKWKVGILDLIGPSVSISKDPRLYSDWLPCHVTTHLWTNCSYEMSCYVRAMKWVICHPGRMVGGKEWRGMSSKPCGCRVEATWIPIWKLGLFLGVGWVNDWYLCQLSIVTIMLHNKQPQISCLKII